MTLVDGQREPERAYHLGPPGDRAAPLEEADGIHESVSLLQASEAMPPVFKGYRDVQQNGIAHRGRGRIPGDGWKMSSTKFDLYCFQPVA